MISDRYVSLMVSSKYITGDCSSLSDFVLFVLLLYVPSQQRCRVIRIRSIENQYIRVIIYNYRKYTVLSITSKIEVRFK